MPSKSGNFFTINEELLRRREYIGFLNKNSREEYGPSVS